MFQPKAHRIFPVLALTAAFFFAPLASALAEETAQAPAEIGLLEQIEVEVVSIWDALWGSIVGDAGARWDDNG
ncbi:MAG TPA: hypothetical protein VKM72_15750 [Thermoanaerobaculia bacterium]|nr:hypothetical protein [Thermoanaerobaculia bacterium]